ncbi:MAG: DUF2628 domain-containing protein [Rhizobiales bacterium]|nr:DUF2628 domain-containing protein [Hyphomicrobiales bacterium]
MSVYTVHEPPPRADEAAADPERFVFVRDGFHFWAFVLGPLWMLWHRLWLVFFLYVVLSVLLQIGLWSVGATPGVKFLISLPVSVLIGLEHRRCGAGRSPAAAGRWSVWSWPTTSKPPSAASSMPGSGGPRPGGRSVRHGMRRSRRWPSMHQVRISRR